MSKLRTRDHSGFIFWKYVIIKCFSARLDFATSCYCDDGKRGRVLNSVFILVSKQEMHLSKKKYIVSLIVDPILIVVTSTYVPSNLSRYP